MAKIDFRQLDGFMQKLKSLEQKRVDEFNEAAVKELAARLLRKVIKRTKPYVNIPGDINAHTGGTLRRGWTVGEVLKSGNIYTVEVINPVKYASYVEYGHRGVYVPEVGKTLHLNTRHTEGKFMLTISTAELEREAPRILEQKLARFLGDALR